MRNNNMLILTNYKIPKLTHQIVDFATCQLSDVGDPYPCHFTCHISSNRSLLYFYLSLRLPYPSLALFILKNWFIYFTFIFKKILEFDLHFHVVYCSPSLWIICLFKIAFIYSIMYKLLQVLVVHCIVPYLKSFWSFYIIMFWIFFFLIEMSLVPWDCYRLTSFILVMSSTLISL